MVESLINNKQDSIFIVFLVVFVFLGFLIQQHSKLFLYYLKATFSPKLQVFQRDDTQSGRNIGFGLDLFAVLSFFIFYITFLSETTSINYFLVAVMLVSLIWGKRLMVYALSRLFEEDKLGFSHITQLQVNNRVTGMIIFPLAFMAYYAIPKASTIFVYTALVFLIVQFGVRFVKLLLTSFRDTGFPFYISFTYLCILEILPILIIYKYQGE